ncbi:MAG: alpha/beta hydrolase [Planctomycetes bacterium]|nr:alpha/beta hydrolase [Planctomycetota bacterium]
MSENNLPQPAPRPKPLARRVARSVITFLLTPYLALTGIITVFQRSLIYHPTPDRSLNERSRQLSQFHIEPLTVRTTDGSTLNGWHIPADADSKNVGETDTAQQRPTVLYFCGNAGHRAFRLMDFALLQQCQCNVVCFDYRGYGDNPGSPSEASLAADAQVIWKYLTGERGLPAHRIIIWGESLGGGVATRLAAEASTAGTIPAGLVLRSTFSSLTDAAAYHFPWLPVRLLLVDRFPSISRIPQVKCPILIVHGERDTIVPFRLGENLFAAAPAKSANGVGKTLVRLPQADHNDVLETSGAEVRRSFREFLDTLSARDAHAAAPADK